MSKQPREGRRKISLTELMIRANELREYIDILQAQVQELSAQLTELQLSLTTIDDLPEGSADSYVMLDRMNTVFLPVKIIDEWHKKLLVNIGGNYYIKTDKENAVKLLNKRIAETRRLLDGLQRQLVSVLTEYNYIQQILASAYVQAQQTGKAQG